MSDQPKIKELSQIEASAAALEHPNDATERTPQFPTAKKAEGSDGHASPKKMPLEGSIFGAFLSPADSDEWDDDDDEIPTVEEATHIQPLSLIHI